MRFQSSCWPGLWSSESLTGAGGSASQVAYTHACWGSAGCWLEVSVPPHVDLCIGLELFSRDMAAGFSSSEWSKREQRRNCNVFSEVTPCYFLIYCCISQIGSIQCVRDLNRDLKTRRQELLGIIGEGGYHSQSLCSGLQWFIVSFTLAKHNHPFTSSSKVSFCFSIVPSPEPHQLNQVQGQMKLFGYSFFSVWLQVQFKCTSCRPEDPWITETSYLPPPTPDIYWWDSLTVLL